MTRNCFSFNEFGPLPSPWACALLTGSARLCGPAALGQDCSPKGTAPRQMASRFPAAKFPGIALRVGKSHRTALPRGLAPNRQHPASACWPLAEIRPFWNPLDQHGLTAVTLLGEEPLILVSVGYLRIPLNTFTYIISMVIKNGNKRFS